MADVVRNDGLKVLVCFFVCCWFVAKQSTSLKALLMTHRPHIPMPNCQFGQLNDSVDPDRDLQQDEPEVTLQITNGQTGAVCRNLLLRSC